MIVNKIYHGDCLEVLNGMEDQSVNCCITSPPYFGLRDYGKPGQLGLEKSPEEYVLKMVEVFAEVKRVLKNDGTLWLVIADSYAGSWGAMSHDAKGKAKYMGFNTRPPQSRLSDGVKAKDLIGIPWMLAFALRSAGWYLRQDLIWSKPNPMPESVTDRCTKAHEYIFLLSKSSKYYFDQEAIKTPLLDQSLARLAQDIENQKGSDRVPGKKNGTMKAVRFGGNKYGDSDDPAHRTKSGNEWKPKKQYDKSMAQGGTKINGHNGSFDKNGNLIGGSTANKRSVWTVTTKPYNESHFATFPQDLIVDMIKAGCPENGIVLDCFMGAGTTALVARKLNRNFIGIELNEDYIKIANKRLKKELGMFI